MKKIIMLLMALVMAFMGFAAFAEEDNTLYPGHSLDMETFDQSEDFTVDVSFHPIPSPDRRLSLISMAMICIPSKR